MLAFVVFYFCSLFFFFFKQKTAYEMRISDWSSDVCSSDLTFGLLDVVNIAHPAFIIFGSFVAYMMGSWIGLDPVFTGILFTPVFFVIGLLIYRIYYESFEKRGAEPLRGLADRKSVV